jgi:hypothetical protein
VRGNAASRRHVSRPKKLNQGTRPCRGDFVGGEREPDGAGRATLRPVPGAVNLDQAELEEAFVASNDGLHYRYLSEVGLSTARNALSAAG